MTMRAPAWLAWVAAWIDRAAEWLGRNPWRWRIGKGLTALLLGRLRTGYGVLFSLGREGAQGGWPWRWQRKNWLDLLAAVIGEVVGLLLWGPR